MKWFKGIERENFIFVGIIVSYSDGGVSDYIRKLDVFFLNLFCGLIMFILRDIEF